MDPHAPVGKWLALLLLAAAFAGCVGNNGDEDDDEGGPSATAPPAATFLAPVAVGAKVGEPGVVLESDGTLWVHAPGSLWKSTDNGTTWQEIDFSPGVVLGGDADLAIGKDGTLFYTDLEMLAALSVFTSTDDGASWVENPVASMVSGVDRQWIAVGPDASPVSLGNEAAYLVFNHLATNVYLTKSIDGGKVWVGKTIRPGESQTTFWSMGNLIVDPDDGAIYAVYALGNAVQPYGDDQLPIDYQVRVSVSHDGAITWEEHVVVDPDRNPGHIFPVIARDEAGGLYAVWAQETEDHFEIHMSTSTDHAVTWSAPVRVNRHNGTGVLPWIDARAPGEVAVAWYGTNDTAKAAEVEGDWFVYQATTRNALDPVPDFEEVKVWNESVRRGPVCTLGIMCEGGRELLDFFQVRIGPDGATHFAFADTEHASGVTVYYARQTAGGLMAQS